MTHNPFIDEQTTGTAVAPAHAKARTVHDTGTGVILALLLSTSIWYGFDAGRVSGGIIVGVFYGALTGLLCEGFAWLAYRGLLAATGRLQMALSGLAMLAGAGAGAVISLVKISETFTADSWVSTALVSMSAVAVVYCYVYKLSDAMGLAILKLRVHANSAIFGAIEAMQNEATNTAIDDVKDEAAAAFRTLIASTFRAILPATTNSDRQTVSKFRRFTSYHWQRFTDKAFNTSQTQ